LTDIVKEILREHGSDVIKHHGVKGMRWGHRKEYLTSTTSSSRGSSTVSTQRRSGGGSSSTVLGSEHFSKSNSTSMNDVAQKINKSYGHKIDEYIPIDHTKRSNKRLFAFVDMRNKKGHTIVHVTDNPKFREELLKCQKRGWFVPTDSKHAISANITHESAHSMFHQINTEGKSFKEARKVKEPIAHMRDSAWKKAEEQARKDGDVVSKRFRPDGAQYQMAEKLSKYAHGSLFIEEHEAELFTAYHWSKNPPKFVDAFMNDLHKNMGVEVKPFSGRKVSV